ncbi:MFS transporter, partial [Staphylococcus epidermidis]
VGLGIFTSSIFIFIYTSADTWKMTWIVLSLFSLIMGSFVLFGMRENPITENEDSNSSNNTNNVAVKLKKKFIWGFSIAYFCEGAGYI